MNTTPTPETDAFEQDFKNTELATKHKALLKLARKLERERDEAWKLANSKAEEAGMFRAERDEARQSFTKTQELYEALLRATGKWKE